MRCPSCDHDNIAGAELCEHCGLDLAGLDVGAWGIDPDDPLLAAPISSLPVKVPLQLAPTATVSDGIHLMQERGEGCVFVVDDGEGLVGVVTERDLIKRVAAPGRDPAHTRLEEIMTRQPMALRPTDPFAWALHRMGVDGFRHIPLVNEGKLVGFVSVRSVIDALANE